MRLGGDEDGNATSTKALFSGLAVVATVNDSNQHNRPASRSARPLLPPRRKFAFLETTIQFQA